MEIKQYVYERGHAFAQGIFMEYGITEDDCVESDLERWFWKHKTKNNSFLIIKKIIVSYYNMFVLY